MNYQETDPEFMERYRAAFGELVQDATRQAQRAIAPALSTLTEIMEDKDEQASARIQAARSTLELSRLPGVLQQEHPA